MWQVCATILYEIMLTLFEKAIEDQKRDQFLCDHLFQTLYPGLEVLAREYDELSPTQVWDEAQDYCAKKLRGRNAISFEVIDLYNKLLKRYRSFLEPNGTIVERTARQAQYTAICVITCLNFRLTALPEESLTADRQQAIREIISLIGRHPIHIHLIEAQRRREEMLEKTGQVIATSDWLSPQKSLPSNLPTDDDSLTSRFNKFFRQINMQQWRSFVILCEERISFKCKIDRLAYIVFANQKSWLKYARSLKIAPLCELLAAFTGTKTKMQQSEVSRKLKVITSQKFYDTLFALNQTNNFEQENFSLAFFKTLQQNVNEMHEIFKKSNH